MNPVLPPNLWGLYHGLLAAAPSEGAGAALVRAAEGLETRLGFEEASAFLRRAAASEDQGLRRSAWAFLGRRDLAAALMPRAGELLRAAGLDPESVMPAGETRPEGAAISPWWFESKFPLREGRGGVPLEAGALAVGDDKAIDWLCRWRERAAARQIPSGFSPRPHLFWIPKDPVQAIALNLLGGVFYDGGAKFRDVNASENLKIRSLFPFPAPARGDYFMMDRRLHTLRGVASLCREGKMPWRMLYERIARMMKTIGGVREILPGPKRSLVRNPGLALSLGEQLVPYPRSEAPLPSMRAFSIFRHQFWEEIPEALEERIGGSLMDLVPENAVIQQHQFFYPQYHRPQGYGRALRGKEAARFLFVEAERTWAGAMSGGGVQDRSEEFPEEFLEFSRELSGFFPRRRAQDPAAPEAIEDQKAERMSLPAAEDTESQETVRGRRSRIDLDATVPLSAESLDALRAASAREGGSGLAFDDTTPGIPVLSPEDRSTRKARGLLELLGRIFRRDGGKEP